MPDRASLVADLLTETEFTDDDARLCAVIDRWPDLSGDEFRRGLELALERLEGGGVESRPRPEPGPALEAALS